MPERTKIPLLLPSSTSDKGCLAGSPLPRLPHQPPPLLPFLPASTVPNRRPRGHAPRHPCRRRASAVSIFHANPPSQPLPFFQAAEAPARRSRWWAWPWRRRGAVVIGGGGDGGGSRDVCRGSRRAALGWGRREGAGGGELWEGACGLWFSMEESSREGGWWPPARADGDGGRKKMRGG
jgi:hypothetical protein